MGCFGALDGIQIKIKKPVENGAAFMSRKGKRAKGQSCAVGS